MSSVPEKVKEYYSNDIVYKVDRNKKVVFGVVVDSYEGYSEDMEEDKEQLQKGQIKVLWNNSSRQQIWRQNKVHLVNRTIIPGDIVRRLEKDRETQRGYCKDIKQVTTVQVVGTDKVIEHVQGTRLQSVAPFDMGDAVCLDTKFGRILANDQMITMESECGAIVTVLSSINTELDDYWLAKKNRGSLDAFYPSQEILCIPAYLEQPTWIKKTRNIKRNMHARLKFKIQKVEEVMVGVVWHNSAPMQYWNLTEVLEDDIKRLKVLKDPSDVSLELAERRLLKLHRTDVLIKKKDWIGKLFSMLISRTPKPRHVTYKIMSTLPKMRSSFGLLPQEMPPEDDEKEWWTEEEEEEIPETLPNATKWSKSKELIPGSTVPVEVLYVESKVTVVWQDGTEEKDIPSTQLYYSISLDDHEFFPGEWVVDEKRRCGVIQNVNYLERTACIKWFLFSDCDNSEPKELDMSEQSVYDLKKHNKFVFRPGSVVKSIPSVEGKIGRVIDSCIQGYVMVQWLDSAEENCWPHNIELIPDRSEDDLFESDSSEDDPANVSWDSESNESYTANTTDESVLITMASRLDFVRVRISHLLDVFKKHNIQENFSYLKELFLTYESCGYLDRFLGASFFSLKSRHFQMVLTQAKEKAKIAGVEMKGRLFTGSSNTVPSMTRVRVAEKENINRMIKLENKINAQISKSETGKELNPPSTLDFDNPVTCNTLCAETLSMLKYRMDLAYAEIISRMDDSRSLTFLTKALENVTAPSASTPLPSCVTSPEESYSTLSPLKPLFEKKGIENEPYGIVEECPTTHHYFTSNFENSDYSKFLKAVRKEYKLLKESLPPGVWVRSYGNRIDLLTVMIRGPAKTPYEDGLFLFDIQLGPDYPLLPPLVHYISYSSERLNPNLYVEGKVCISLLGTWMGKGTEVWGPDSTLLQLIVSIQGLILVSEPYYNEAGYEKLTDTQQGYENSRTYNELVILKLVQSMKELLLKPPEVFKKEILNHFSLNGKKMVERLKRFCCETDPLKPDFPLLPVSKGLRLSLGTALNAFEDVLRTIQEDGTKA